MKSITALLIGILPLAVFSQSYTSSHLPSPGDTLRISEAMTTAGVSFQSPGQNQTWDFSALTAFNQRLDSFAAVTSMSTMYQMVFNNMLLYPNNVSNLVLPQKGQGPQAGTNGAVFFRKNTSDFRQTGTGISMSGTDIPIAFDSPDYIYRFPISTTSPSDSCVSGYEMQIPGIGFIKQIKRRKNTVDASGTLITPFGTFADVIRIRSDIEQWDSISMDTTTTLPPITSFVTEYKWLKAGYKLPLLTISQSQFGISVEYLDIFRGINWWGIGDAEPVSSALPVYPNPSNGQITIEVPESVSHRYIAEVFSISGQRLFVGAPQSGNLCRLSLDIPDGIYMLKINGNNQSYTSKILIKSDK